MLHNEKIKATVQSSVGSKYGDHIPGYYETHNTEGWVKDALESEVDYWRSCQPVLLDAPTGCGKTTFVYDVLVKRVMEKGKNLLLISNRLALSLQQKKAIQKITGIPSKGHLTDEGLQAQEDFGPVRVITYHRLPTLVKDPKNEAWLQNVAYMVADEVHFFTADSLFNDLTGYYLSLICKKFQHAVRMYMTATPEDIFEPLKDSETYACRFERMVSRWEKRNCIHYHFNREPAPCQLHFFDELNDLRPRMEENPSERWLIFVDSKIKGKSFADTLGTKALYLDADSKGSEEYRTLLLQESFEPQVLITTSVFDNGINISDPTLKHVAVIADDRTEFLQMVGRKRLAEGEHFHLWVQNLSARSLVNRIRDCKEKLHLEEQFDEGAAPVREKIASEIWRSKDAALLNLFYLKDGELNKNRLAFWKLHRKLYFYETLNGPEDFRNAVRSWLQLPSEEEGEIGDLETYMSENLHRQLGEKEQDELRKLINYHYKMAGFKDPQPTRADDLGVTALNNRLKRLKLPWVMKRSGDCWIIEKY